MTAAISIRRAAIEDAGRLAELTADLGYPTATGTLIPWLAEVCGRSHTVTLRSRTSRNDAHAFYERIGYDKAKTQFKFTKSLRRG